MPAQLVTIFLCGLLHSMSGEGFRTGEGILGSVIVLGWQALTGGRIRGIVCVKRSVTGWVNNKKDPEDHAGSLSAVS